jgi:hypothetical protein
MEMGLAMDLAVEMVKVKIAMDMVMAMEMATVKMTIMIMAEMDMALEMASEIIVEPGIRCNDSRRRG